MIKGVKQYNLKFKGKKIGTVCYIFAEYWFTAKEKRFRLM